MRRKPTNEAESTSDCGGMAMAVSPANAIQHRVTKCNCVSPTTYRQADGQDYVCVTPESASLIRNENAASGQTKIAGTANNCKSGFVWRDAFRLSILKQEWKHQDLKRCALHGRPILEEPKSCLARRTSG